MPSIPFFSSFFSSTPASNNMSYPDQRTDKEWRAVLSPGKPGPPSSLLLPSSLTQLPSPHAASSPHIPAHSSHHTEQFRILRQKGTEAPGTGTYNKHYPSTGTYACAGCSAPLYTASQKFDSHCGWPAYFEALPGAVRRFEDSSLGMVRTEITCANCGGHLGHVFKGEGFGGAKDERHCVNSVSLRFSDEEKK